MLAIRAHELSLLHFFKFFLLEIVLFLDPRILSLKELFLTFSELSWTLTLPPASVVASHFIGLRLEGALLHLVLKPLNFGLSLYCSQI